MVLYRLTKKKYSNELSGIGAAKFGNRWNSKGVEMIYTAENKALSLLEVYVHLDTDTIPNDYILLTIYLPDNVEIFQMKQTHNFELKKTRKMGDEFIDKNQFLVMKVPSAIVPGEYNYLLNPDHKDFSKLKIIDSNPFPFDKRLFEI